VELFTRACSLVGVVTLGAAGWIVLVWTFSPLVTDAVSTLHQTCGY
jgi:hypothetical protein